MQRWTTVNVFLTAKNVGAREIKEVQLLLKNKNKLSQYSTGLSSNYSNCFISDMECNTLKWLTWYSEMERVCKVAATLFVQISQGLRDTNGKKLKLTSKNELFYLSLWKHMIFKVTPELPSVVTAV